MGKRLTDQELLHHLQDLARKLGRTPKLRDIRAADGPCVETYIRRFGSIKNAQLYAGEPPDKRGGARNGWTNRELERRLRTMLRENGRTPSAEDIDAAGPPYLSTYLNRYGSLAAAQQASGCAPNGRGRAPWEIDHPVHPYETEEA